MSRTQLTLSRAQQTRTTASHDTTTAHISKLHAFHPSRPPRAPHTIAPQPPLYRRLEPSCLEDPLELHAQSVDFATMGRTGDKDARGGGQVYRSHGRSCADAREYY